MAYIFNSIQFKCRSFTNDYHFSASNLRFAMQMEYFVCEYECWLTARKVQEWTNERTAHRPFIWWMAMSMTMMMMVICELSSVSWFVLMLIVYMCIWACNARKSQSHQKCIHNCMDNAVRDTEKENTEWCAIQPMPERYHEFPLN